MTALQKLREAWKAADLTRQKIKLAQSRQVDDVAHGHLGFAAQHIENTIKAIEEAAQLVKDQAGRKTGAAP